jgi:hypothetical protein
MLPLADLEEATMQVVRELQPGWPPTSPSSS